MLALIAGQGDLPALLHRRADRDILVCEMAGFPSGLPDPLVFEVERLGTFLHDLRTRGITDVCFAGAMRRPRIDMKRIDMRTMPLVPRMMAGMGQGDDALLRTVIALFEEQDLRVVSVQDILPDLLPPPGIPTRAQPTDRDRTDADRAAEIHRIISPADIGQALAVAHGQALAVEATGGTDWMLRSLAADRPSGPDGGLLYKAPKIGQDRRIDLPIIGPATVGNAAAAALSGIVIEAGGVLLLDADATVAAADDAGLFLWIREP